MTDHQGCGHDHSGNLDKAPVEWREVADRVRNWGRWGQDDELGTLNHITPERIRYAASLAKTGKVISCGVPLNAHGPQGAHGLRRNPIHLMTVDGNDRDMALLAKEWQGPTEQWVTELYANAPGRFTDDYIIMPLQSCTQWDALSHFFYEDKIYNGYPASAVTSLGAVKDLIEPVAKRGQIVGRGVLLDVARHRGVDQLGPDEVVPPEELDAIVKAQGVEIRARRHHRHPHRLVSRMARQTRRAELGLGTAPASAGAAPNGFTIQYRGGGRR